MPLSKRIYDSKEVGLDCDKWAQIFSALILKPNQLFKKQCYLYFTVLQLCGGSYNTKKKKKKHSRQELEWTKWIFHAVHMIIFTGELGNSLLFFLFFTNSSQLLFALKGLIRFGLLWKYSCGRRTELLPFSSTLFFFIYFARLLVLISRPVWSDFHQLRSEESLVLCLLCCPIRASPRRKLSPQVHHGWWEMKRKEEVTWALP